MNLANKAILVTGTSRGVGRELVNEALRRGAGTLYDGARRPLKGLDSRIKPVMLDVTDAAQIRAVSDSIKSLDVLINNAGVDLHDDLGERAGIERHLAVNLFGTYGVTQAFLPLLARSRGALVNVLSLGAVAPVPFTPAYSIHAVLAGSIDTDMTRGLDIPKASSELVARAIFDGLERREDDIFPDSMSAQIAEGWQNGVVKALEQQFSAFVPPSGGDPA